MSANQEKQVTVTSTLKISPKSQGEAVGSNSDLKDISQSQEGTCDSNSDLADISQSQEGTGDSNSDLSDIRHSEGETGEITIIFKLFEGYIRKTCLKSQNNCSSIYNSAVIFLNYTQ